MHSAEPRHLSALVMVVMFTAMAALPARAALFALVDTGELYRSTNGGATWTGHAALPVRDAVGICAASTSADLFLITRSGSLYRSTNGGGTWLAAGAVTASDVTGFTLGPTGAVVALTESGTVYVSQNAGGTFTAQAALPGSDWVSLARAPQGRLVALARSGNVVESQNGGTTWTTRGVITVSNAVAIRRLGTTLFALTETGEVYRSADLGTTWTALAALTSSSMGALMDAGGQLVAATREGEVAVSATGATWSWIGAINQLHVIALGNDTPTVTGVDDEAPGVVETPRLVAEAPYPNPRMDLAPATFPIRVSAADAIRLELYDVHGRIVAVRREEQLAGGRHAVRWDLGRVPAGTYYVRLIARSGSTATVSWTQVR